MKGNRYVSPKYWSFFSNCQSGLEAMHFRVIRYKFNEFFDHDFCYLQSGWLQGVIFVKRQNCFEGSILGSFSMDLIGFWTMGGKIILSCLDH